MVSQIYKFTRKRTEIFVLNLVNDSLPFTPPQHSRLLTVVNDPDLWAHPTLASWLVFFF